MKVKCKLMWITMRHSGKGRGGVPPTCPVVTTATAVKVLTVNFSQFDRWPHKILGSWPLTITLTPSVYLVCCEHSQLRWHFWQQEGTKSVIKGLLLVLCTCNLFGSMVKSSLVPRPLSYLLVTQQARQQCTIDCTGADRGLGTRVIFTVYKATVLGYFDRWPATKTHFDCWPHFDRQAIIDSTLPSVCYMVLTTVRYYPYAIQWFIWLGLECDQGQFERMVQEYRRVP